MTIFRTLLTLLLPVFALAQQSSFRGTVTDADGLPLPYAQVHFPELEKGASADASGKFQIPAIPFGPHRLLISQVGYQQIDTTISFGKAKLKVNFRMQEKREQMQTVTITDETGTSRVHTRLKNIEGTAIYAAKKNEVIELKNLPANLASNNSRQVFARVPGVVVWESDCAGLQLGVGARGLSPDRTSNFNTRQNGVDMAADALGYPESYYAPPMQAIDRIEIVRGAASLQYGTQFGGMINLKLKRGNPDEKFHGSSVNTYNSLGYFNTFNDFGGQSGKLNYYSFLNYRSGNCGRENSDFYTYTAHARLGYQATERLEIIGEYTRMNYLAQQPGGLTDFQFEDDPYQSLRSRNWFAVDWNMPALHINYDLSDATRINSRSFALLGSRKAVGFLSPPNRLDLQPFINRDLLVDQYQNFGNETRLLHRYRINSLPSAFLAGVRVYRGNTEKTQGFGSRGSSADFRFVTDSLNLKSDYRFPSFNAAAFVENVFNVSDRLSITPGIRYEFIRTRADGFYDSSVRIPNTGEVVIDSITPETRQRDRSILLAGIGAAYRLNDHLEFYTNFSQNYRAITFNDMRVVNPSAAVDPELRDERGFNMDLGVRGNLTPAISIDAGLFWLSYSNRIGSVLTRQQDEFFGERLVRFTTNVADAEIFGLESYVEVDWLKLLDKKSENWAFSNFVNLSLIQSYYHDSGEKAIEGKSVENVPFVNFKAGVQSSYKKLKLAYQFTHLGDQYSEATNSEMSPNGIYGLIPSYWVMDLSASYDWKWLKVEAGVNNLTDNAYFTRRASGYPGPGIITSAQRHFYLGLGAKF